MSRLLQNLGNFLGRSRYVFILLRIKLPLIDLQQNLRFSSTFWHEQRRDFNSNRAAVSRIRRKFFTQMYPIQLVNPDGSTVRIRYDVPKQYVKVNSHVSSKILKLIYVHIMHVIFSSYLWISTI